MRRKDDPDVRRKYAESHDSCAVCGISAQDSQHERYPAGLVPHHIYGGARRDDVACNLLMLCATCHDAYHGSRPGIPPLTLGNMLWAKAELWELDDKALCAVARRKTLPALEELPDWFRRERERNCIRWYDGRRTRLHALECPDCP